MSWCDGDVKLSITVDADSLHEAVALAAAQMRESPFIKWPPAPMSEFRVAVLRDPIVHALRLHQVQRWATEAGMDTPANTLRKQRIRELLGLPEKGAK